MTRILGFALLQIASIAYAQGRIAEKRREYHALRSYCDMLEQLQGLLESDGSPMPELLQKLSGRCSGEARTFADALCESMRDLGKRSFQELWLSSLGKTNVYGNDIRQELESLACVLGRYDLDLQIDALKACQKALRHRLGKGQGSQAQDTYMTVGLALSASLLLGILLL